MSREIEQLEAEWESWKNDFKTWSHRDMGLALAEIARLRALNAELVAACEGMKGQLDRYFARLAPLGCEPWIDPGAVGEFEVTLAKARASGQPKGGNP